MQRIIVKNFQSIKEMEIELNQTLVLIGEQASGKSTISKLIYFCKSLKQDFIDLVYESLESDDFNTFSSSSNRLALKKVFGQRVFEKFYNFFGSTRHLPDFEITFYYVEERYLKLSLYPDKGLNSYFEPQFYSSLFDNENIRNLTYRVKQYSGQSNAFDRQAFQKATRDLEAYINNQFNDSRLPLFVPAGRNITVNYPEQFKLDFYGNLRENIAIQQASQMKNQSVDLYVMTTFLTHVERLKQRFRDNDFSGLIEEKKMLGKPLEKDLLKIVQNHIEQIMKGEYRLDQYGEKLFYDDENYVHLNNASSGQQEVIRILQDLFITILDQENVFRVVEEPEAHLYPMAQKYLVELIAVVLNQSESQFIITTHSPYILSVVNNLLFASRVVEKNQQAVKKVQKILPQAFWLKPMTTNVYFFKDGTCQSIVDKTSGLIEQSYLDDISEDLGADFEELYQIHAEAFA